MKFALVGKNKGRRRWESGKFIVFTKTVRVAAFDITVTHMDVSRHDLRAVSWREKQAIKNSLFGAESTAIELFPPESQLIGRDLPHWSLWILPEGMRLPVLVQSPKQ